MYQTRLKPIDYQSIIQHSSEPWEDDSFPAELSVLLDPTMSRRDGHKKWETFVWKRPKDVYGEGQFSLFDDKIDPNDINQGYCNNCWFLASVASVAEFPARIKRIFLTETVNDAGCYAVELYLMGEKRTVVVDDRLPYCTQREDWAFSRPSSTKEIWVMILEKAWAKVFGSY